MTTLHPGQPAPSFIGKTQNGATISLSDYKGKKVALYFYPHDMTPTCTIQACNLRDNYQELIDSDIIIIGVSEDTEKKHQKFIGKYELPFDLIADTDHKVHQAYCVWGPKTFMGKEYEGTHRTTFLINEDGEIIDVIQKVKAKEHHHQILEGFAG
jgi:thioredoxin-dependent peroxiredoxin